MNKRLIYLLLVAIALLNAVFVPMMHTEKKDYSFTNTVSEVSKEADKQNTGFFDFIFKKEMDSTFFEYSYPRILQNEYLFFPFLTVLLCFFLLIAALAGSKPGFIACSSISLVLYLSALPATYYLQTAMKSSELTKEMRKEISVSDYIFGKGEGWKGLLSEEFAAGFWIALALFVIILIAACVIPDKNKKMFSPYPGAAFDPYAPQQQPYFIPQNDSYAQNTQNGYYPQQSNGYTAPEQPYSPAQNDPYAQNMQNGYYPQQNTYNAPQNQQNGYAAPAQPYSDPRNQQNAYNAMQNGYAASQSYYTAPQSENVPQKNDTPAPKTVSTPTSANNAAASPARKLPMKFCPKCNEFTNSRTFCQKCGTQLIEKDDQAQ